jgi:nitrite reductase/ring-hydroxylating ferredoxin subunit
MPDQDRDGFVELIEVDQLWDAEVLVLKVDGQLRAYDGTCPHQSFALVEGDLKRGVLTCRAHEWQFDALSGTGVNPRGTALTGHDVRVNDDGMVCVRLRAKASSGPDRH